MLTAYVSPVALNTTNPKLNIWEIALLVGGGMKLKGSVGCNQLRVLTRLHSWNVLTQGLTLVLGPLLILLTTRSSPHELLFSTASEASGYVQHTNPPTATEFRVLKKLTRLNPAKASGPDGIPACLLKENADILPSWLAISLTVHTRRLDYPVLEGSRYCPCSQADRWGRRKQALETNITYSCPFQVNWGLCGWSLRQTCRAC